MYVSLVFKFLYCVAVTQLFFLPLFYLEIRNETYEAKNNGKSIQYNRLFWHADNESGTYVPYTDSLYISKMSNPEKAAVAFSSISYDNYCDPLPGSVKGRCSLIEALGLGEQCSDRNVQFLEYWFVNDKKSIGELQGCEIVPLTASYQERFVDVSSAKIGNLYLVKFTVAGMDLREMKTWNWQQIDRYILRMGRMIKLDSKISSRKEKNSRSPVIRTNRQSWS
jgi:hypothetical protein